MKLLIRTEVWSAALLAALGVVPSACGGKSSDGSDQTAGGDSSGGTTSDGGSGATSSGATSSGGASGGDTSTGGSGATAGTGNHYPCVDPGPFLDDDNGYLVCDNGVVVRDGPAQCVSRLPRPTQTPGYQPGISECQQDADCKAKEHGHCEPVYDYEVYDEVPKCFYGCVSDDECGSDEICECADPVGACVPATCASADDCGPGFSCASYTWTDGCGQNHGYSCQTEADACLADSDCVGGTCGPQASSARECVSIQCVIGRPFLVDEVARVAVLTERDDWADGDHIPRLDHLTPVERSRLADSFTRAGQLEHASIAAFARFALELLACGAPPQLLALTTDAMADEQRHARLCFGFASAYAGRAIGPGALVIDGALDQVTLESSVVSALREGCIGETVAALEAGELSERVSDPCLASAFRGIASDERRHAELAWQFIAWALRTGNEGVFRALTRELETLQTGTLDREEVAENPPQAERLAEIGVLPVVLRNLARSRGLTKIVIPTLAALLEQARPNRRSSSALRLGRQTALANCSSSS